MKQPYRRFKKETERASLGSFRGTGRKRAGYIRILGDQSAL